MSVIEKFGITPGPWEVSHRKDVTGYPLYSIHGFAGYDKNNEKMHNANTALIAAAPTLGDNEYQNIVEAKIACNEIMKAKPDLSQVFSLLNSIIGRSKEGVEKATGRTWDEVKELSK